MTHEGHISLYKGDDIITRKFYRCMIGRNRIINMWKGIYGKGIIGCSVHISPIPRTEMNPDGTNKNLYTGRSENGRMTKTF